MARTMVIVALAAAAALAAVGCYYKQPPLREWYGEIVVDMDRQNVIDILGEPTVEYDSELMYIYDDPEDPARFRFVLDEDDIVVAKYYEPKAELARRAREQTEAARPEYEPLPGERAERSYPGGPLPDFDVGGEHRAVGPEY